MPDDWMLWKLTALMLFAPFPTINSISSNAAEPRLKSHHVVGFPMENRTTMTRRDGASELPYLNEGAKRLWVVRLARHRPEGQELRSSDTEHHLNYNDAA
jgi:hypothetical protein